MSEENNKSRNESQPRKFDQQQYDMLKRCSDKKDMTEWNEWREKHPDEVIWLQGRNFDGWYLQKVNFMHWSMYKNNTYINFSEVHLEGTHFEWADLQKATFAGARMNGTRFWSAHAEGADFHGTHLVGAELGVAHFENCDFNDAILENASFTPSWLIGANFTKSDLRGCSIRGSVVDGSTKFWEGIINRYSKNKRFTDTTGTPLDNVIIDPATKQLLKYNIRRLYWENWYKEHKILKWIVQLFWLMNDYGNSTWQIILWFFGLATVFAAIYYFVPGLTADLHVDSCRFLNIVRACYFSIITMVTGFEDINPNDKSIVGHIIVTVQVVLGWVLLGALVARLAVLFTGEGPGGEFAGENKKDGNNNVF